MPCPDLFLGFFLQGGFSLPVPKSIVRENCFPGVWRACGCVGLDGGAMEASSLCRALLLVRQARPALCPLFCNGNCGVAAVDKRVDDKGPLPE